MENIYEWKQEEDQRPPLEREPVLNEDGTMETRSGDAGIAGKRSAGLGDWADLVFLGKFFKNFGQIIFLGNILLFLSKTTQNIDYFWAYFYHRPALVF